MRRAAVKRKARTPHDDRTEADEAIALQSLGTHFICELEKLQSVTTRAAAVCVKEIEVTLPFGATNIAAPVTLGAAEPLRIPEALRQLATVETRGLVTIEALKKIPAESLALFTLRIRF